MITLCIETSTASAGIAITNNGRLMAESLIEAPGKHQNALLFTEIKRLIVQCGITVSQIDLFSCASGPGSFTGVRTGVAAVQGLALATDRPTVGVSTLAMLAMNLPFAAFKVCPMLDARKSEVYAALYRVTEHPEPLIADTVVNLEDFLSNITDPVIFLGDGALRYQEIISQILGDKAFFTPYNCNVLRPSAGCLLAEVAFKGGKSVAPEFLQPTYLRASQAELSVRPKPVSRYSQKVSVDG